MNRDFRFFWAGQVTSAFGSVFTAVAIPLVAVRDLGATPAETGLLAAASALPLLVFGLPIGMWADRLSRRRPYLIGCDLLAAAALGCLVLGAAAGRLTVWAMAAFAFLLGTIGLFLETVYFAHLRCLVPDGDLVRARARLQGGEYAGGVLGRALAGPAAAVGALVPFLVDLITYLVSACCLALIRKSEPRRRPARGQRISWEELGGGLALLRREPFLRLLTPFLVAQQIVTGVVLALLAPFLLTELGVPTSWYGLLFLLVGVAGAAGSVVADRLGAHDPRRLTVLGYLGVGVMTALLPTSSGPLPVAAGIAALGIGLPYFFGAIANVGLTGFVTAALPEASLGRISVSLQLVSGAAQVGGSLLGGVLAQQTSIRFTLWLAAGLSLLSLVALRPVIGIVRLAGPSSLSADPAEPAEQHTGAAPQPAATDTESP